MAFATQAGAAVRVRRTAQGGVAGGMSQTRKLVAILVVVVVGYSRLAGADEDRTLALRSDLIDPTKYQRAIPLTPKCNTQGTPDLAILASEKVLKMAQAESENCPTNPLLWCTKAAHTFSNPP